jgi:alpha-beta hydrolase superfamily lysophospholipase
MPRRRSPGRAAAGVALALAIAVGHAQGTQRGSPAALPASASQPASRLPQGLERFTVQSDGHPMAVWARRPPNPRGSVLLIHGMTWSTRPDFDLQVPGLQRSVMASLVEKGFAAYGVDLRGYGETPRDASGWLTPKRSAVDVTNVVAWVAAQHPSLPKPALVGWSRGAAISAMVAQVSPSRVSALVLFGFVSDPDLRFVDGAVSDKPQMLKNTAESAASDFVSPKVTPAAVVKAYVEQALKADPVRVDLRGDSEFNLLEPARLKVPSLVLYGSEDVITDQEAGKFFAALGTPDKQMVVLPDGDHAALIEDTHDMWIAAVVNFLMRPAAHR